MRWRDGCFGLLLVFASAGADVRTVGAGEPDDCACRLDLSGRFRNGEQIDHLLLCARSDAGHPACDGGFSRERLGDIRWTIYFRRDGGQVQRLDGLSGLLNHYDYTAMVEVCRDPDSGRDQALFAAGWGGSGQGDRRRALFVYYDADKERVVSFDIDAQFVADDCSRRQAIVRRDQRRALRQAGRAVYTALRPDIETPEKFGYRALPTFDMSEIQIRFGEWNRRLAPHAAWRGVVADAVVPPSFVVEPLVENRRWRILALYYLESERESWGVLLAQHRESRRWFSFYDVPGGSDKRFLFLPEGARLRGDRLLLKLCVECEGWGVYEMAELRLVDRSRTVR